MAQNLESDDNSGTRKTGVALSKSLLWLGVLVLFVLSVIGVFALVDDDYRQWAWAYITRIYSRNWPLMGAEVVAYSIVLLGMAILVGWNNSALKRLITERNGTNAHDIVAWLLRTSYVTEVLVYTLTYGVMIRARWILSSYLGIEIKLMDTVESILWQQVIFILVVDFVMYWVHRSEHKYPALWAFHKFHHSATQMNVITSRRVHPVESEIIKSTFFVLPFALLGVPFQSIVILRLVLHLHAALVHSGIHWQWGFVGRYILVSPAAHEIHHSRDEEHRDKNFGNVFIFFDHIFGTYYQQEADIEEYGVTDDTHNDRNFVAAMWSGFVESTNVIKLAFTRRRRRIDPQEDRYTQ